MVCAGVEIILLIEVSLQRALSGSFHGQKKANLPLIFLAQRPVVCRNSGKSLCGLVGLMRRSAISFVLTACLPCFEVVSQRVSRQPPQPAPNASRAYFIAFRHPSSAVERCFRKAQVTSSNLVGGFGRRPPPRPLAALRGPAFLQGSVLPEDVREDAIGDSLGLPAWLARSSASTSSRLGHVERADDADLRPGHDAKCTTEFTAEAR